MGQLVHSRQVRLVTSPTACQVTPETQASCCSPHIRSTLLKPVPANTLYDAAHRSAVETINMLGSSPQGQCRHARGSQCTAAHTGLIETIPFARQHLGTACGQGRQQPGASCSGRSTVSWPTKQQPCFISSRRTGQRTKVVAAASAAGGLLPFGLFGGQQQQQDLWDYEGSSVRSMSLGHAQTLHRLSFGHRNQRTYVLVVYAPGDQAAVLDLEAKVERLASGLRHEGSVVVAKLNVTPKEAADFAYRILGVTSTPAVLLYPEAAPGCLRYAGADVECEDLLGAINAARLRAQPTTHLYELMDAYTPLGTASLPLPQQQTRQQQQGLAGSGGPQVVQSVAPLQRLSPVAPGTRGGYWTSGRAAFWGIALLASMAFFAWDRWLEERWAAWSLQRRQKERKQGHAFTARENVDDFMELLLVSETLRRAEEEEEMGQRELGEFRQQ